MKAVAEIEQQYPSAWAEESIYRELLRKDCLTVVICRDDRIAGWLCCRVLGPEAELLKIAVCAEFKRHGLGTLLFDSLIESLTAQAVTCLFLEVRARNRGAILFYQSCGFTEVGRRLNYYRQPQDDALQLKKNLALSKREREQQP